MGNARSSTRVIEDDIWWTNGETYHQEQQTQTTIAEGLETLHAQIDQKDCDITYKNEREQRKREMQADFIKFKQELTKKHDHRRQLIAEKKKEMANLREELTMEKQENARLRGLLKEKHSPEISAGDTSQNYQSTSLNFETIREENEDLRNEVEKLKLLLKEREMLADKNKELRISLAEMQRELQNVNSQIISFEKERIDYQEHVTALKDIIRVTKEMLRVRESQIEELKKKISSIEELLASKEINILSDDLRQEYERQLRNIRDLRILYEDRQRVDKREKENLKSQIEDLKKNVDDEQKKNGELTERVNELEEDVSKKYDKIVNLESNLGFAQAECKELHAEMDVINQLFSQILISFNNDQDVDLDGMIKILEENHDLLTKIVINDESNQAFALPKVLLDLVKQVNENKKDNKEFPSQEEESLPQPEKTEKLDTIKEEEETQLFGPHQLNSPEEIVENLPKVWRVLIELLSHQCAPSNEITEKKGETDSHCYKSVETPSGMSKVLSVSKTFIRLKSLILEKKSLEKEMTRLKQLNTHLEGRLSDQEKRLVLVSNELSKTWNFVGKMQKQHQQLHTQEKILRYELAQKRKLLTELKEELEYCRQKWLQARKQNSSTEEQWKLLRTEFASRKGTTVNDINNSVESGYSDDKSSSSDEEDFDNRPRISAEASSPEALPVKEDTQEATSAENNCNTVEKNLIPENREDCNKTNTQFDNINEDCQQSTTSMQTDDLKNEPNSVNQEDCNQISIELDKTNADSLESTTMKVDDLKNKSNVVEENLKKIEEDCNKTNTQFDNINEDCQQSTSSMQTDDLKNEPNSVNQEDCNQISIELDKTNADSLESTTMKGDDLKNKSNVEENLKKIEEDCNKTSIQLDVSSEDVQESTSMGSDDDKNMTINLKGNKENNTNSDDESVTIQAMIPIDSTTPEHISSHEVNINEVGGNCESLAVAKNESEENALLEVPETRLNPCVHSNPITNHVEDVISSPSSSLSENTNDCIGETSDNLVKQSTSNSTQNGEALSFEKPSTSHKNPVEAATEFAARREARMKRLEEQCNSLYFNVAKNSLRGLVLSNKLDNLHQVYGEQSQNNTGDGQQSTGAEEPQQEESSQDADPADQTNQE